MIIRRKNLPALLGVSLGTVDRWRANGTLPPPVRLGTRLAGWELSTIKAWVAAREGVPIAVAPTVTPMAARRKPGAPKLPPGDGL